MKVCRNTVEDRVSAWRIQDPGIGDRGNGPSSPCSFPVLRSMSFPTAKQPP